MNDHKIFCELIDMIIDDDHIQVLEIRPIEIKMAKNLRRKIFGQN